MIFCVQSLCERLPSFGPHGLAVRSAPALALARVRVRVRALSLCSSVDLILIVREMADGMDTWFLPVPVRSKIAGGMVEKTRKGKMGPERGQRPFIVSIPEHFKSRSRVWCSVLCKRPSQAAQQKIKNKK